MHSPFLLAPLACLILSVSAVDSKAAGIRIFISVAPPPLPLYEQPECPSDGYLWNPGYWAWGGEGYYWVPGTWVQPPVIGLLWTPGYWSWGGRDYVFHRGYWSRQVGFYGGINYGYGYGGSGYDGGHWEGRHFSYNRAITNISPTRVRNFHHRSVAVQNDRHTAYNGGRGGVIAAPSPREQAAGRARLQPPTQAQTLHRESASRNPELRASVNRGKPPVAATGKSADFSGPHTVPAQAPGGHVDEEVLKARPRAPRTQARQVDPIPTGVDPRITAKAKAGSRERPPRERSHRDSRSNPAPRSEIGPHPEPVPPPQTERLRPNQPELPRLNPKPHPVPHSRPKPALPGKEEQPPRR